ncbi:uncharacterized protein VP01_1389g5 [Puccinia sorghi]|uniref:Meiotically up-regulated protein Msb1/Mug8 domain-containing protein n=1 Tax=Puccinia sorghi TaxID=27349 RepID=A0A0L6VLD6_9BASI|nr:uncharacterized protein VP01_1389g5 [Puccinia sorghi]
MAQLTEFTRSAPVWVLLDCGVSSLTTCVAGHQHKNAPITPLNSTPHLALTLSAMHSFFNRSKNLKNKLTSSSSLSSPDSLPQSLGELGRIAPSTPLFSNNSSTDNPSDAELQLMYGYIGLHTEIELDLPTTARAVNLVAQELKARALETPLLFSTHALDISTEGTHSLIRRFVHNQHEFPQDLVIHGPENLAAFLKWLLSRYVNGRGTHGIIAWEQYASWRESEKGIQSSIPPFTFGYPDRFFSTHLLAHMPAEAASLLSCLLDLFASASVRADLNGMTAHKCGALFGAYIFGLEDDKPFETTYSHWLRQSHATEHLILAYMRDLKTQSPTGKLPSRMESTISGYPSIIPSLIKTHPSARLEKVARFQRLTPFYSSDLISSAGTWNVVRSKAWDRLRPYPEIGAAQYLNHTKAGFSTEPSKLFFSPSYKRLLNIRNRINFEHEDDQLVVNFEGPQRFKNLVEKEWSGFLNRGFQEPDAKKLEFDLEETSSAKLKAKRETMDWDSFSGAGFLGRETYRPTDLDFKVDIQHTPPPSNPPSNSKKGFTKKLIKNSRSPAAFPHDTTPIELPSILVDENFFEAWADILVSSGWSRDELKEVSWVLIHCKCKPADHKEFEFRPTALNPDGRNDDMWTLFEEVVPPECRTAQLSAQKATNNKANRRSFLRVITRKESKRSPQGSTHEKAAPAPGSSLSYYPIAPESQAPSISYPRSRSPSNYHVGQSDSPSRAAFTMPQFGHTNLFRSFSKMVQGGHSPVNSSRLHAVDNDTESLDQPSSSSPSRPWPGNSAPWVVVSDDPSRSCSVGTTRGVPNSIGVDNSSSENLDRPSNPSPPPSDRPEGSPSMTSLDGAPGGDPEGPVHDGSRFSEVTSSIASNSDFTIESVERFSERSSFHLSPPPLIPSWSVDPDPPARMPPATFTTMDAFESSNPPYTRSSTYSSPLFPSGDKLNSRIPQQSISPPREVEQQRLEKRKVLEDRRQRLEQLRLQQQQQQQQQAQEQRSSLQPPHQATLYARSENALQQQQPPLSPAPLKLALRKVALNSPSSLAGSLDSPGSGGRAEGRPVSLRKAIPPLDPVPNNHFSSRPVLPPQFDIKAKKVSNIVDLFEQAQPKSPSRFEHEVRSVAYTMPPSPVRIPVRSLKLSRVGEQEEK